MRIFGSFYQFFDFAKGPIVGLKVSVLEFFRALCHYSTFDQIHLYIKDPEQYSRYKEIVETLEIPLDQLKRLSIFPALKLAANLQDTEYEVFFHGDPINSQLSYIRTLICEDKIFPLSAFVHDLSTVVMPNGLLLSFLADYYKFDTFICPSKAVREVLSNNFKRITDFLKQRTGKTIRFTPQLVVAPLGIDAEKFKPGQKEKFRSQLKLPADKVIILLEGRLSPYHKMDLFPFIQVIKRVSETVKNKNFLFLIVGQEQVPGYAENLRKLGHQLGLDTVLQVVENFDNQLVPGYFGAADIFVSPSDNIQETFGLTPLEAMSSGLPVVISDWNGYKESVNEGVEGFKIPTIWGKTDTQISRIAPIIAGAMSPQFALAQTVAVDVQKMAEALQKLIDNHNLRKKMGQAARQRILEKYSWKVVIKEYEKIWTRNKHLQLKEKPRLSRQKIWLENIPYFNFYKHYPTRLLGPASKIKATAAGQVYLETGKIPITDENIARIGNATILKGILEFCLNKPKTVTDVLKFLKVKNSADRELFHYQILFMLKHNLLTCLDK